jgi:hypothetical protein
VNDRTGSGTASPEPSQPAQAPTEATSARRASLIESGSRSLAMAGRALDPNGSGGPDLALARLLLGYALLAAARANDRDEGILSARDAVVAVERSGELGRAAGSVARGRAVLACLEMGQETGLARDDLVQAELLVGRLIDALQARSTNGRAVRWRRVGFALLVAGIVAVIMVPTLMRGGPWEKYRWMASSATDGFSTTGTLGQHGQFQLVFHTNQEAGPWILIDLLKLRTIHSLSIRNREDCCDERCIPLVVEVAGDDQHFVEVARRKDTFDVWKVVFPARQVRYVRLRVEATTIFHLREIVIR